MEYIVRGLSMRTCLFHPHELANHWYGHVHPYSNDKIRIAVGHCQRCCSEDDSLEMSNYQAKCKGCFGILDGFR